MKMLGRRWRTRCPICRTEPGPDCAIAGATTREARKIEKRELEPEILEELHDQVDTMCRALKDLEETR